MSLVRGSITEPGAQVAAAGTTPETLHVAVAGSDGVIYFNAWDQTGQHDGWRGWWLLDGARTQACGPVKLVRATENQSIALVTGIDGCIYTTLLGVTQAGLAADQRGWTPTPVDQVPSNSPVTGVPRHSSKLDMFVVGADRGVYTAAWDQTVANATRSGWCRISGIDAVPGSSITALSRATDKLDVFVVGADGGVYTAAWNPTTARGDWRRIGARTSKPGGFVTAVSRAPDRLDAFMVGADGGVYTAAWDPAIAGGDWRGWWRIGILTSEPGGFVTAVSRGPTKLDVFAVAADGEVVTAAWNFHVDDGDWRGWWPVAGGRAKPGSMVGVVARTPAELHAFVVGLDGVVWTSSWNEDPPDDVWRGWWPLPVLTSDHE